MTQENQIPEFPDRRKLNSEKYNEEAADYMAESLRANLEQLTLEKRLLKLGYLVVDYHWGGTNETQKQYLSRLFAFFPDEVSQIRSENNIKDEE